MAQLDTTRPFRTGDGLAAGLTPAQLRGPRFRTVLRGVKVDAATSLDLVVRAEAALLVHPPSAVLTHHTAAELQGLPVPTGSDVHVSVRRKEDRRRHPGVRTHVGAPQRTTTVRGLTVSTGVPLFVELARTLDLVDLVVLGDALVARGLVTLDALQAGVPRRGQARRAASFVRDRVESPMESRVRMLLVLAGFPDPSVNAIVDTGRGTFRPDLCWGDLRLVVEYDGRHHRADLDQWDHDLGRREWFEAHGWTMVVLVARDVYQRPDETVRRVLEAWRRCGGASFRSSEEWRAHFPGRAVA